MILSFCSQIQIALGNKQQSSYQADSEATGRADTRVENVVEVLSDGGGTDSEEVSGVSVSPEAGGGSGLFEVEDGVVDDLDRQGRVSSCGSHDGEGDCLFHRVEVYDGVHSKDGELLAEEKINRRGSFLKTKAEIDTKLEYREQVMRTGKKIRLDPECRVDSTSQEKSRVIREERELKEISESSETYTASSTQSQELAPEEDMYDVELEELERVAAGGGSIPSRVGEVSRSSETSSYS